MLTAHFSSVYIFSSILPTCHLFKNLSLLPAANLTPTYTATFIACLAAPPLCCTTLSQQHLSLIWNEEEMPPCGLTSGPSSGLAEIDACDPAALIYSLHPQGSGRLHYTRLERTRTIKLKKKKKGREGKAKKKEKLVMNVMW